MVDIYLKKHKTERHKKVGKKFLRRNPKHMSLGTLILFISIAVAPN